MKKLLVLLLVALCAIAYRSPDIMNAIGLAGAARDPSTLSVKSMQAAPPAGHQAMSAEEFARLSKTDPQAYRKFVNSHRVEEERSEVDKLMNFFARGKYE